MLQFLYQDFTINFMTILFLVFFGAFLRFSKIISKENLSFLNDFTVKVLLPCLILSSFMNDLDPIFLSNGIAIFIWALSIHGAFIVFFKFYYAKKDLPSDQKDVLSCTVPLGNIYSYGIAVASMLYGDSGIFTVNMYSIATRIYMYTYCLMTLSGAKLSKNDLLQSIKNPAILVTIIGAPIFFLQDFTPQITINDISASIFRIDHSLPFIFNGIEKIGSCTNTMVWILIGASFTKEAVSYMLQSRLAMVSMAIRAFILPPIGIAVYTLLHRFFGFTIAPMFLTTTLLLLSTPVANIGTIFALKYNKAPNLALACIPSSFIFTLALLPFYILVIEFLTSIKII